MKYRVALITSPVPQHNKANVIATKQLLITFHNLCNNILVFCNNIYEYDNFIKDPHLASGKKVIASRVLKYIYVQIKYCYYLLKFRNNIDIIIFFIGNGFALPALLAKLINKPLLVIVTGRISHSSTYSIPALFEVLVLNLASFLGVQSPNLTAFLKLSGHSNKVRLFGSVGVDFQKFRPRKSIDNRNKIVGYVGRLSSEKGISELIDAIFLTLKKNNQLSFTIIGDGPLRGLAEKSLIDEIKEGRVVLTGWVNNEDLPNYYNDMKLVIMPSYTEGLPGVLLESMACGTPVLASAVGGIPDIIENGVNGFLLNDLNPNSIANKIIEIIDSDLRDISLSAIFTIHNKYNLNILEKNFRKTFNEALKGEQ